MRKPTRLFELTCCILIFLASVNGFAQFTNGQNANVVLGQPDFVSNTAQLGANGMYNPRGIAIDNSTGKVFIADFNNGRVLRFSSMSAAVSNANAEAVLGQPDLNTYSQAVNQNTLSFPTGLAFNQATGSLWVADPSPHRVLKFENASSLPDGANASAVIGQVDFTSSTALVVNQSSIGDPIGIAIDNLGNLWVADQGWNRVMMYANSESLGNGASASLVLGQPDFVSSGQATSQNRMWQPTGVTIDNLGNVWVAEAVNNRVLMFANAASLSNGANATTVLGQNDFISNTASISQSSLSSPLGLNLDASGTLWVCDQNNSRLLGFANAASLGNGANADVVLGAPDFVTNSGSLTQNELTNPTFCATDAQGSLYVSDSPNNRVLRFNNNPVPGGNAIQLNGTTDYVSVPDNSALRPASLTVEAWVKFPVAPTSNLMFISKAVNQPSTYDNSFALFYSSNALYSGIGTNPFVGTPWTPTPNLWYHIAFTYDETSQQQTVFVNGVAGANGSASSIPYDGSSLTLGADIDFGNPGGFFEGMMDEVRVWSIARTQSEIQSTLNTSLTGNEPGLVAYYKMDDTGQGAGITVSNSAITTGSALDGLTRGTGSTPVFSFSLPQYTVTTSDSLALVAIYNGMSGNSWTNKTNWLTGKVNTWFGVTVSNYRVTGLALPGNVTDTYNARLAAEIGNLTALTAVDLSSNYIHGTIPISIGTGYDAYYNYYPGLTSLANLNLSNNQLIGDFPTSIATLSSLATINISGNKLTGLPDLSPIYSLTSLNVSNNNFTFEDLEPNAGITGIVYSPQQTFSISNQSLTETQTLTITSAVGGTANQYQWKKDAITIAGANSTPYTKPNVLLSDAGSYVVEITNSLVPGLALISDPSIVTITTITTPPVINSFTPTSGPIGTSVTINGNNFSSTPANNIVFFGATKATVTSASVTQLTVTVPSGATYQPISVAVNNLIGYSSKPFSVTFTSSGIINASSFSSGVTPGGGNIGNIFAVITDLDLDGKNDIALSARYPTDIQVYKNSSSAGSINAGNFSLTNIATNGLGYLIANDLDADGKQDLTTYTTKFYKNNTSPGVINASSFGSEESLIGSTGYNNGVTLADLDGDGRQDIVSYFGADYTNRTAAGVLVYRNVSANGVITAASFAPPVRFETNFFNGTGGLALNDMDGDGKTDMLVIGYDGLNRIAIFRNTSFVGSINPDSFSYSGTFGGNNSMTYIDIADLNGDGKPEIVMDNSTIYAVYEGRVKVLVNHSTPGTISLSGEISILTDGNYSSSRVFFRDLNGDAKPEVLNFNGGALTIFKNVSSSGVLDAKSFAPPISFPSTAYYNYEIGNVATGDIDGDGKPDLVLGNGSIFRNIIPDVWPTPTITSFSPSSGSPGDVVVITGTNFSACRTDNIVKFNNTLALVTASTATSITAILPEETSTGTITVTVAGQTGASGSNFTVNTSSQNSLNFSASNDVVQVPYSVTLNPTSELTMEAWVNLTNTSGTQRVIGKLGDYTLSIVDGQISAGIANGISNSIQAGTISVNAWTHLAVSFKSGGNMVAYLNGVQVGSIAVSNNPISASSSALTIGSDDYGYYFPNSVIGSIDEVVIWNMARTSTEILSDFQGSIATQPSILAYYDFNEGIPGSGNPSITTLLDRSDYANHGTLKNFTLSGSTSNWTNGFQIPPAPTVSGFSPASGFPGSSINIAGTNFATTPSYNLVKFNGRTAVVTASTATSLTVVVPDGATSGLITVTGYGQTSTSASSFTVTPPPQNALNFVGSSANQVVIPHSSMLNPTTELTIEAWVNLPDVNNNQKIVGKTNFNGYLMAVANGGIYNEIWNSNNGTASGVIAGTILPNTWTHLAVTFKSGGNMISYINGLQVNSTAVGSGPIDTSLSNLLIGNSYGYFSTGTIDEVALWNVARTPSQIQGDMLGAISPSASLLAYYDFNQGTSNGNNSSVNILQDRSNNGNNGTLSNFTLNGTTSNWVGGYTPPAPTITSFSPTNGSIGASVTITGTNFSLTPATNIVSFNGTTATVTASTSTSLTVTVPSGATTGNISVTVGGQTATSLIAFSINSPPVITSFNPTSGVAGNMVAITGTNFDSTPANNVVKFNGTSAIVSASSANSITTTVPIGATTGSITVTVNGQTATSASNFIIIPPPTITSFAPVFGPIGTTVTITGTNFDPVPANNIVKFNGTDAVVTASTTTSITTTVPAGATTGTISVTVNGQTATSSSTYLVGIPPPTITSFSPTKGPIGTAVTINGTFFDASPANNHVKFNGTTTVVTASTESSLTAAVPFGATSGPLTVTRDGLTATSSTNFSITVSSADSLAVVALYTATGGANWNNKTNWLSAPIANWFGITVSNTGLITSVSMPSNNLTGALPTELTTLDELTSINVSGNRITSLPDLSGLTALTSLSVSNNKLEFATLEPNVSVAGIVYAPQDSVDVFESVLKQLGTSHTFTATVSGTANSYQWKKNNTVIAAATNPALDISNIAFADDASYRYETTSSIVTGLTLQSRRKLLRVSSLERDSIALRTLYTTTNGANWTNKTNWLTTPLKTGNWFGISIVNERVTQVNLPNNNLTGPVSEIVADIQNLVSLDLSNNKITSLPDLTSYPSISKLDVSKNKLDFASLEKNAKIAVIDYSNQADIGVPLDTLVNVGSPVTLKVTVGGSSNTYQWKRNGNIISEGTNDSYKVTSIGRSSSGSYLCEITSALVPGLVLRSAAKKATAVANVSGQLLISSGPVAKGSVTLFKIRPIGTAFDITRTVSINADGGFLLEKIVLDDYILVGQGDKTLYADYFPTYYKGSVFWATADTIRLNENRNDLNITLTGLPAPPKGDGIIRGVFEVDIPGGRLEQVENRGRVSGASATVRRSQGSGRPAKTMTEEIIEFVYTDENGEFDFVNLEEGTYLLNIEYPGVPMDPKSDVAIAIGSKEKKENIQQVFALAIGGKIVVTRSRIVGVSEEEQASVEIYPNPVTTDLYIYLTEGSGEGVMKLFNELGQEVITRPLLEGRNSVDMSRLGAGIYFLKVYKNTKQVTAAKIVVSK